MDDIKTTNYTLPLKGLGARPWNIQTIHDALKKCRDDPQAKRNLCMQARQMTTDLYECFERELSILTSLSEDERKSLLSDVHKYNRRLLEFLREGKGKEDLDFVEHEILSLEYTSLVKRLRDLQKSARKEQDIAPSKRRGLIAWLKNHPHRYGLTVGVIFLILFIVLGLFKAQWRPWCWGTAGIAFLVLIVSLLGGRFR